MVTTMRPRSVLRVKAENILQPDTLVLARHAVQMDVLRVLQVEVLAFHAAKTST